MSNYRNTNGLNYGNDYVPGPGEHFMGDTPRDDDRWMIQTFNAGGRNEVAKEQLRRDIMANAPEGSILETHVNADGSETFVLKTPTGRQRW